MTADPQAPRNPLGRALLIAAAVSVAVAVAVYIVTSGTGNDGPGTTLSGTPIADLLGYTPEPDTGVLEPRRPTVGEVVPDFALRDVREPGIVRKLSDYRGRAVVLNWFATWCGPCKAEVPTFQAAQDALGDQVVFLGIDFAEDRDVAARFLASLGATYPALLDSNAAVADHYRVGPGLPVTFFIDRDGVLRAIRPGEVTGSILVQNLAKVGITYQPR